MVRAADQGGLQVRGGLGIAPATGQACGERSVTHRTQDREQLADHRQRAREPRAVDRPDGPDRPTGPADKVLREPGNGVRRRGVGRRGQRTRSCRITRPVPEQPRDGLERCTPRQRDHVAATVVQASVVDERERGVEYRQPPIERVMRGQRAVRPALPGGQHGIDRRGGVAACAARPRPRLRAHQAAADVGVQRASRHAEPSGGLFGGQQIRR